MIPKATKKKRWVRARPRAPVHPADGRQGNAVESSRDEFFTEAFRLSPHPISITELETGVCLEINDACLRAVGFRREEVIGRTTLLLRIWPDAQDRAGLVDRLRSQGTANNLEVSMRTKHGEARRFLISVHLITLRGTPCLLAIGNDLTDRKTAEDALQSSDHRFATFMDNLHGFAWIKDVQGRYLYVNRLFRESLLQGRDWNGKTAHELWPVHVAEPYELNDRAVRETGVPLHTVESFIQQGEVRHALVSKFPIVAHQEEPALFGGVAVDITERQRTEELLKQQADMLNHSSDAIVAWKVGGGIVYWNRGAEELYGWRSYEVIGLEGHALLSANPLPAHTDMETALDRDGRWSGELFHVTKDGRQVIVESRLVRVAYGGTDYILEFNRDMTERKSVEEALHRNQLDLHQQQVQLEELTAKLLNAQERERQRIARELHDDVSQRLAALVLEVASLEQRPASVLGECAQALAPLREQLEQLSDDVHTLAYRLHPSLLEHAGLCPAVEDHVHQVSRRVGLPISLRIAEVPAVLSLDHATCLFRVMQESVQNVVKHAQATAVTVQLRGSSKGVGLSVTDNGKGVDLRDHQALQRGLGLSSMEERLRQLQGYFQIQSQPDGGTKVCAWIPCEAATS